MLDRCGAGGVPAAPNICVLDRGAASGLLGGIPAAPNICVLERCGGEAESELFGAGAVPAAPNICVLDRGGAAGG
ncbi:MAG: hypothetical protein ACJ790_20300 [Myxococcaceae bacterium]